MLDIHCHILAGVDDGAPNNTASLSMAKQAEKDGVHTIIATPHHQNGLFQNKKQDIIHKTDELNAYLQAEKVNVRILPGQETRIYDTLIEDYENGEILTLGNLSTYILIELPPNHIPRYTSQLFFDIQMKGLTPIISNPERNKEILEQPDILYSLVKNGAATQIDAGSLKGLFGKKIQKLSFDLIEANLAHFIASNGHNTKKNEVTLNEALMIVKKKYGSDTIDLFMGNAKNIMDGMHIFRDIPKRIKKRKVLGLI